MEMIVVIGVMTVVLMVVTQMFILNYNIFENQSSRSTNETGAILAVKDVSQMTRGALNIEASHVFGSDTRTSSSSALVLRLPTVNATGSLITDSFDYVAFYADPADQTRIMSDTDAADGSYRLDGTRLITAHNQAMIFRYNAPVLTDADRVSLYVVNSQTQRDVTVVSRGWTSIFLRNLP